MKRFNLYNPLSGEFLEFHLTEDQIKLIKEEFDVECKHTSNLGLVQVAGGGKQLKQYCSTCGQALSQSLKREKEKTYPDGPNLDELRQSYRDELFRKKFKKLQEFESINNEIKSSTAATWRNYLSSKEWKEKRELVLERANYICEGCGIARAEEIHHLTYERRFMEMLFDLVALCPMCHSLIHFDKNAELRTSRDGYRTPDKCDGCRFSGEHKNMPWCHLFGVPALAALKSEYLCDGGSKGFEELR